MVRPAARASLATYRGKRDFSGTPEPAGALVKGPGGRFVVHEHHATNLHFDLRLEMGGVLKSFAVPKGPSMDPKVRRLAVETEDHPVQYLRFQGVIGDGHYGAGEMVVWDKGRYTVVLGGDPLEAYANGKFHIVFEGEKLRGEFILIKSSLGDRQWLLFKKNDAEAVADWQPVLMLPYGPRSEKPEGSKPPEPLPAERGPRGKQGQQGKRENVWEPKGTLRNESGTVTKKVPKRAWPKKAKASAMPDLLPLMLATLADKPFDGADWVFETKWDGWRAQLRFDGEGTRLTSRNRKSLDGMFPELGGIGRDLAANSCLLDGEIVALGHDGMPRFQLLQNRLKGKQRPGGEGRIVYYAFDILFLDGMDLRACALLERKALLKEILPAEGAKGGGGFIRYSEHFEREGIKVFREAARLGLEGILAKRKDSAYLASRSAQWLKVKTKRRQEVVIAGFTSPRGSRSRFGALVAGLYQGGVFTFAGHVGGGFDAKLLKEVHALLHPLRSKVCPFPVVPKTNERVEWVKPLRVAEVEFAEWTDDGRMRQPVFLGLRPDKDPKSCSREIPLPIEVLQEAAATGKRDNNGVGKEADSRAEDPVITHPDKVLWPDRGFTKAHLADYYRTVAPYLLPHLKDRPLILKRFPNGVDGPPFYQHEMKGAPPFMTTIPIEESEGGMVRYALCQNRESLLYLANLAVIPQNPWLSRVRHLERPDFIVFDLDPQDVPFSEVCAMAKYLGGVLEDLGLKAFPKTSGSRGIHIYVPLKPAYDFSQSLGFAQLIAALAVKECPGEFTVERSLKLRKKDRIYLDCMQNSRGKSVASVYSARERPGAHVSAPLLWSELKRGLRMEDFDIESMPKRLAKKGDLFQPVLKERNSLDGALRKIEKKLR